MVCQHLAPIFLIWLLIFVNACQRFVNAGLEIDMVDTQ